MKVDVRIIAATHRNLAEAVAQRQFREDLYYRLRVYPITLPALRGRNDDIPSLCGRSSAGGRGRCGRHIQWVPPHVMEMLQRHSWPGNIRELEIRRRARADRNDRSGADAARRRVRTGDGNDGAGRTRHAAVGRADAHPGGLLRDCEWRINGPGNAAERLGIHPNTLGSA
jgi:formate hydrogenlyase transcriptional activator